MNILLTGGTGFIGSHTAVELITRGHKAVLYDNLCNSDAAVVDALEKITGKRPLLVVGDIRDTEKLQASPASSFPRLPPSTARRSTCP